MLTTATTLLVILILLFFLFAGFYAGIIKSIFAVSAGFFAIVLAESYPNQEGINYWFVFIVTAVVVFIIGIIVFKVVKFLYLSLFDKISGACLGFLLGFLLSANFVIPTINKTVSLVSNFRAKLEYMTNASSKILPMFGKYVPGVLYSENLKNLSNRFNEGLNEIKNINKISEEVKEKMKELDTFSKEK